MIASVKFASNESAQPSAPIKPLPGNGVNISASISPRSATGNARTGIGPRATSAVGTSRRKFEKLQRNCGNRQALPSLMRTSLSGAGGAPAIQPWWAGSLAIDAAMAPGPWVLLSAGGEKTALGRLDSVITASPVDFVAA